MFLHQRFRQGLKDVVARKRLATSKRKNAAKPQLQESSTGVVVELSSKPESKVEQWAQNPIKEASTAFDSGQSERPEALPRNGRLCFYEVKCKLNI